MKKLKSLFFVLVAVISLLCSYNTYAYDVDTFIANRNIVSFTTSKGTWTSPYRNEFRWTYSGGSGSAEDYLIQLSNPVTNLKKGDYASITYFIWHYDGIGGDYIGPQCPSSTDKWVVVDCDYQVVSDSELYISEYNLQFSNLGSNYSGYFNPTQYSSKDFNGYIIRVIMRANQDFSSITSINTYGPVFRSTITTTLFMNTSMIAFYKGTTLTDILNYIKEHPDNAGQVLEDQRDQDQQDMENAQGDASTDGSSSGSQATSSGQTLLQAFISFVTAITNASPSNCNINMNTGYIDFGNVNLCALSPPPAFQVISSIVVIGFAVPLSLAASKKMIELFRSFQT